jgi:tetratricopeptide (TPR) repeat protein
MSKRRELSRLRQAAEAGNMDAATELADMLEEEGDLSGAERWNRRAAQAGNYDGIVNLGLVLCMQGKFDEAEPWLRKGAADPRRAEVPGFCEAVLGKCLASLGKFDEAEQCLAVGAAAGIDFAVEDLERLRKARADGTLSSIGQSPDSHVLQTFEVDSVMFYDGVGHRLGSSVCTLTRDRLIIDDARGGISQIPLRDITGVSTPAAFISPKQLRVTAPGIAYDIYCVSKNQKYDLEAWLSEAIRRSLRSPMAGVTRSGVRRRRELCQCHEVPQWRQILPAGRKYDSRRRRMIPMSVDMRARAGQPIMSQPSEHGDIGGC